MRRWAVILTGSPAALDLVQARFPETVFREGESVLWWRPTLAFIDSRAEAEELGCKHVEITNGLLVLEHGATVPRLEFGGIVEMEETDKPSARRTT